MDYETPESLRLMQETIRRFVNQDLEPLSQQVEDGSHPGRDRPMGKNLSGRENQ